MEPQLNRSSCSRNRQRNVGLETRYLNSSSHGREQDLYMARRARERESVESLVKREECRDKRRDRGPSGLPSGFGQAFQTQTLTI